MKLNEELDSFYITKDKRKKILLITDDIRAHSGVGTISREIIFNTGHHFNWVQMAGAVKHPDKGKVIDLSQNINQSLKINDGYLKLYPVDGYGDVNFLRALIKEEKPDALLLVTDPRYFQWLFQIENEIRKEIPIIYLNIWDDLPLPYYNKPYYESCDLLLGISKQTKYINDEVLGEDKGKIITKYLPHGLNPQEIFPLDINDKELTDYKNRLFQKSSPEFIIFFNSRNIKRKQLSDTVLSFRLFLDSIPKEKADKCCILLHTESASEYGTDIKEVCEVLFDDLYPNSYLIHEEICSRKELNFLYNIADLQILLTSNEGWGLSITESLLSGTPFIANVTGGMQDQMGFKDDKEQWYTPSNEVPSNHTKRYKKHGEWVFPVFPTNISLQGSINTPYIYEDRCDPKEVANVIKKVWMYDRDFLRKRGLKGREWALSDEIGFTSHHQALRFINSVDELFNVWEPIIEPELVNLNDYKKPTLNNLIY